jgi:hypothetical protein
MTRKKPRRTTLDVMVARIVVPVLTTTSQEELREEFTDEFEAGMVADAFEYVNAGAERVRRLKEELVYHFEAAETGEQQVHIANSLTNIGELGEAIDDCGGDAHEAWLRVFGVRTYRHKKRQEKLGESLATLGHLERCMEL